MVRKGVANQAEAEESACRHFERGLKSKEKGEVDEACRLLRAHPSLAAQFLPGIRLAVRRSGGDVTMGSAPVKRPRVEEEAAELGIRLLPQYTKFMSTPNQLLRFYLSRMEPQIMSVHALKALNPKNARDCPRELLAQIAEYLTGVGVDEILPVHARSSLDECVRYLQARNEARQRRGFQLRLPPRWDGPDGLFQVSSVRGSLVEVSFRPAEGVSVDIDVGMVVSAADLLIASNWSEKGAVLSNRLCMEHDWHLGQEFVKRGFEVAKLGRQSLAALAPPPTTDSERPALLDGAVTSPVGKRRLLGGRSGLSTASDDPLGSSVSFSAKAFDSATASLASLAAVSPAKGPQSFSPLSHASMSSPSTAVDSEAVGWGCKTKAKKGTPGVRARRGLLAAALRGELSGVGDHARSGEGDAETAPGAGEDVASSHWAGSGDVDDSFCPPPAVGVDGNNIVGEGGDGPTSHGEASPSGLMSSQEV